jgi:hypothetical protein
VRDSPKLSADREGIWRESAEGTRSGIRWDEIWRVSGYRLDTIGEIVTVIELDWEGGDFLELNDDWEGFRAW